MDIKHDNPKHELHWLFKLLEDQHKETIKSINSLKQQLTKMALTFQQLSDKIDAAQAAEAQKQTDIAAAITALQKQIADLTAAGTAPDLQSLGDKVDALATSITAIPTA